MNINQIYPIVLLLCVLSALIIWRKIRTTPNVNGNANEISPTTNARLNRIQKVSKCVRLFLQYGIPLIIVGFLLLAYLEAVHKITLTKPSYPSGADSIQHTGAFQLWSILSLILYLFWY